MAWGESRRGTRIALVGIHTNEGNNPPHLFPDRTAENLADWLTRENNAGRHKSYQTIVDDDSAVEYVPDHLASWAMRSGNLRSVNLCFTGWARWSRAEWLDHPHMLARGAAKVRHWCAVHDIGPRRINGAQIRSGQRGVCGHGDWSNSDLDDSTHTDPGPHFPWDVFMDLVEDDMPTPAEIWNHQIPDPYVSPQGHKAQPKPAHVLLQWAATHAAYAKEQAIAARAEVAALRTAVAELAADAGLDFDALVTQMDAKYREALKQGLLDVEVTVRDRTEPGGS